MLEKLYMIKARVKLRIIRFLVTWLAVLAGISLHSENLSDIMEFDALARYHYQMFEEQNRKGNYDEALASLRKYANLRDSVIKLERTGQLEVLQTKYELDKKNQEVQLLEKENALKLLKIKQNRFSLAGMAGLFILVLIVIFQLIRQRKLRTARQNLIFEQMLLRSQMNPHFIFNTLTNIQSFIVRKDSGLSIIYLDNFSELIGTILESSSKKTISLKTEILTITNYFTLQKLRFGEKLEYYIEVDPDCDPDTINLPPMMIQPLIENAIIHGIKPKQGKGRVEVRFRMSETRMMIEVQDDGVGRINARENPTLAQSPHSGLALMILKERLSSMNTKRRKNNRIEIIDLFDENNKTTGTLARIELEI